jgi:hypothetical protein
LSCQHKKTRKSLQLIDFFPLATEREREKIQSVKKKRSCWFSSRQKGKKEINSLKVSCKTKNSLERLMKLIPVVLLVIFRRRRRDF